MYNFLWVNLCVTWFFSPVSAQGLRRAKEYAKLDVNLRHCSWKWTIRGNCRSKVTFSTNGFLPHGKALMVPSQYVNLSNMHLLPQQTIATEKFAPYRCRTGRGGASRPRWSFAALRTSLRSSCSSYGSARPEQKYVKICIQAAELWSHFSLTISFQLIWNGWWLFSENEVNWEDHLIIICLGSKFFLMFSKFHLISVGQLGSLLSGERLSIVGLIPWNTR